MYHSVYDENLNLLTWAKRLIFSDQVTFSVAICNQNWHLLINQHGAPLSDQLVLCYFRWKFKLNIMFCSEVIARNVASKIRLLLHRKNSTERYIIVFLNRCFQWLIRHGTTSKFLKSISSKHNLGLHICNLYHSVTLLDQNTSIFFSSLRSISSS